MRIANPGRCIQETVLGYSVAGSGTMLALGSLRHKQMTFEPEDTVYRLLEAKFVSERASGVGRETRLITVNKIGSHHVMPTSTVELIRRIWEKTQNEPSPTDALAAIEKSGAFLKEVGGDQ